MTDYTSETLEDAFLLDVLYDKTLPRGYSINDILGLTYVAAPDGAFVAWVPAGNLEAAIDAADEHLLAEHAAVVEAFEDELENLTQALAGRWMASLTPAEVTRLRELGDEHIAADAFYSYLEAHRDSDSEANHVATCGFTYTAALWPGLFV